MSPLTAPSAVARARPVRRLAPPRLRVVSPPATSRSRLPYAAACTAVLAVTLVALLMMNIALSRTSFAVHELEQQRALLVEQEQALSEQLALEGSPGRLAERARALGMVPNPQPAFVRLSDGAVLGSPEPAVAPESPAPEPPVPESPAPEPPTPEPPAPEPPAPDPAAPVPDPAAPVPDPAAPVPDPAAAPPP